MKHPTSNECFKFLEETGYNPEDMFPILRLFIADEYQRDNSVLERLKVLLEEMKVAKKELEDSECQQ